MLFLWMSLVTVLKNFLKDAPNLLNSTQITSNKNRTILNSLYFLFHTIVGTSLQHHVYAVNQSFSALEMQRVTYAVVTEMLNVI